MRIIASLLALMVAGPMVAAQNEYKPSHNPEMIPILGVRPIYPTLSQQEQQGLEFNQGAYVTYVHNNTAAQAMGLQPGDIITSFNGVPVNLANLSVEINRCQPGDPANVTVQRNGQELSTNGIITAWPSNIPYTPNNPVWESQHAQREEKNRLARIQDELNQLRRQTQQMAKDTSATAEDLPLLGLKECFPVRADGKPLAWHFQYDVQGPTDSTILAPETTDFGDASSTAVRPWHFTWQLASNRKPQEPL